MTLYRERLQLFRSPAIVSDRGFITKWETTTSEETITLPLYNDGVFDCTVDWGDGSTSSITAWDDTDKTHTYTEPGIYTVEITGECPSWSFADTGDKYKIREVSYWGDSSVFGGFGYLKYGFDGCRYLYRIGSYYLENQRKSINVKSSLVTLESCFRDTIGLYDTGGINGLLDNCVNVTSFTACFQNSGIQSIPSDLFDNCVNATSFQSCFESTGYITEIPSGLFDNCPDVLDFSRCFIGTRITEIPSGLFDNCPDVLIFTSCFQSSEITYIPTDLFKYNTSVIYFSYCFAGTLLDEVGPSIPSGLFSYNTLATHFDYCFSGATMGYLPTDFFYDNTAATTFSSCFWGCSNLEYATGVFYNNTSAVDFSYCFVNCPKLIIDTGMFDDDNFLNKDMNFYHTFYRDTYTGVYTGSADDIWNADFGTGTPITTDCFGGAGNDATSISNYASIPAGWK